MKKKSPKQQEISKARAVKRTLVLCAAFLMEEEGWDANKLKEFYAGIERWTKAIDDHLIDIRTVVDIINQSIESEVKW